MSELYSHLQRIHLWYRGEGDPATASSLLRHPPHCQKSYFVFVLRQACHSFQLFYEASVLSLVDMALHLIMERWYLLVEV